jgi:methyl-accepting chemotaxis protein
VVEYKLLECPYRACRAVPGAPLEEGALFKNLKLGQKIYSVVLLLAIVAELISYVGIDAMRSDNQQRRDMQQAARAAILGEQVNGLVLAADADSRGIYMARDQAQAERFAAQLRETLATLKQQMAEWIAVTDAQDRDAMARINAMIEAFIRSRTELARLVQEASLAEARAFGDNAQERANRLALNREIATVAANDADLVRQVAVRAQQFYESRLIMLIVLAAVGIGLALLAVLIIVTQVTRPITRLTERVTENIRRVAMAATQASSAVGQVSDGSNVQLSALRQAAAALGQSAQAITEVARSTQLASEQAKEAASLVADGIRQMGRMVDGSVAISENSSQVSLIAGAISRIASQTNMLALNAAIEAARAGEHGRGFAVVAEEVRKLAENSGSLAQEIASLVQNATEAADRGVTMAQDVSASMRQIAERVQQSDQLIGAIASAMEQQQVTVGGINTNVAELTRIGQSNATAAEEITATMLDLSKLAERSRNDVDEFRAVGL